MSRSDSKNHVLYSFKESFSLKDFDILEIPISAPTESEVGLARKTSALLIHTPF